MAHTRNSPTILLAFSYALNNHAKLKSILNVLSQYQRRRKKWDAIQYPIYDLAMYGNAFT